MANQPSSSGAQFDLKVPDGDDRARQVCSTCGFINYVNPKIVVGTVALQDGKVLLCKRAIEPRRGFWTLPAGYLEERETVEDGARREAREEANATIDLHGILAIYSIPRISQVQIMFHGAVVGPVSPGPESEAVELFPWDDIPWQELAFPSVHWALTHFRQMQAGAVAPFSNP